MVGTPQPLKHWTRRSPLANSSLVAACACLRGASFGQESQPSGGAVPRPNASTSNQNGMKIPIPTRV